MAQLTNWWDFMTERSTLSSFLPPPPSLEINSLNLSEAWKGWKAGYDTFYKLCNSDQFPEEKRIYLLLQALGPAATSMYYGMDFDTEKDKFSHDAVLSRFAGKCDSRRNMLVERHNSHQIVRRTGESTTDFVDRVKKAARYCEFSNPSDMVRDELLISYRGSAVQLKILGESDMSLENLINVARTFEAMEGFSQAIGSACEIGRVSTSSTSTKDMYCRNCDLESDLSGVDLASTEALAREDQKHPFHYCKGVSFIRHDYYVVN